jgi:hypothetical protein
MLRGKFEYLVYDKRDWSAFPGGRQMMAAVDDAVQRGRLVRIHQAKELLYTSRLGRTYFTADIHVFRRAGK